MATDKRQIQELLGSGLSNEVVASAVGCSAAYVTQLMADEEFAAGVVTLRTQNLTADSARDRVASTIEDSLLDKLKEMIESGQIYKFNDVLRAYAIVNKAVRRGVQAGASLTVNNTVVNLMIPEKVVRTFTTNAQGEVVDVEGQTLVTMPAHTLLKQLSQSKGESGGVYEKISRHIPAAIEHKDAA